MPNNAEQPTDNKRPDVVFFMLDQLSMKWVEAASQGVCPTPNIDALRKRGVTFTRAYTSNPVCTPTRSTLATGWCPHIPEFAHYGPKGENLAERIYAARKSIDWSRPEMPRGTAGYHALPFPAEVSQSEWITRQADSDETRNLAGDPTSTKVCGKLRDILFDAVVLQDYPQTMRELLSYGVH